MFQCSYKAQAERSKNKARSATRITGGPAAKLAVLLAAKEQNVRFWKIIARVDSTNSFSVQFSRRAITFNAPTRSKILSRYVTLKTFHVIADITSCDRFSVFIARSLE